ncbi:MAG: ankyrin repeat domain-containing protein [Methylophilaceae bacterium]
MMKRVIKIIFILFVLYGVYSCFPAFGYRLLQNAVKNDNIKQVEYLMKIGIPAYPTTRVKDFSFEATLEHSPLFSASQNGNLKIVGLLIRSGAKIDACCCSCVTPLHIAIIKKNKGVVQLLLEAGASTNLRFDMSYTALELAKKKSTLEIVDLIKLYVE